MIPRARLWICAILPFLLTAAIAAPVIEWHSERPVLIQRGGNYGRIARVDADTLLASFEWNGAIHARRSQDEGSTWQEPVKVVDWPFGTVSNPELLVLKTGEILCFFNRRPDKRAIDKQPFSIAVSRSTDSGESWGPAIIIYEAGSEFKNGCWEPAALQLPDGEIQVIFANEGPYRHSAEQEISLMRSHDNGTTWQPAETISFRQGSRDGMPVPVLAHDGRTIVMAIEDNGLSGAFKPVIIATNTEGGGWHEGIADAANPRRWGALACPLAPKTYAGAPYLRQLPGGPFVLSFQLGPSGTHRDARMAVSVGSHQARDFGEPTFPFPQDQGRGQLWNSLFIKNATTLTAVSRTSQKGVWGVWTVDGTVR